MSNSSNKLSIYIWLALRLSKDQAQRVGREGCLSPTLTYTGQAWGGTMPSKGMHYLRPLLARVGHDKEESKF